MFYDDYDLDYAFELSYDLDEPTSSSYTSSSYYLDESAAYAYDLDEDYARDAHDLDALAYRHYAWYNLVHTHTHLDTWSRTQNA